MAISTTRVGSPLPSGFDNPWRAGKQAQWTFVRGLNVSGMTDWLGLLQISKRIKRKNVGNIEER
jgi:hypothetical protein